MADALPPEMWPKIPGYALQRELGHGGSGIVFEAIEDSLMSSRVAIKVLIPSAFFKDRMETVLARFAEESQRLGMLSDPRVVKYIKAGFTEDEKRPYLVMAFVEGKSLSEIRGAVDAQQSARIVADLLGGLNYCHEKDVVHRDLKPSNVILGGDGQPVLVDFGLAACIEVDDGPRKTGPSGVGTPGYLAPELLNEPLQRDKRHDLFAVGVLLYELITKRLPVRDRYEPIASHRPGTDGRLDVIVQTALNDVGQRYQSADEFRTALEEWLRHVAVMQSMGSGALPGVRRLRERMLENRQLAQAQVERQAQARAHRATLWHQTADVVYQAAREAFRQVHTVLQDEFDGGLSLFDTQQPGATSPAIESGTLVELRGVRDPQSLRVSLELVDEVELVVAGSRYNTFAPPQPTQRIPDAVLTPIFVVRRYSNTQQPNPTSIGSIAVQCHPAQDWTYVKQSVAVARWISGVRLTLGANLRGVDPIPVDTFIVRDAAHVGEVITEFLEEALYINQHRLNYGG